MCLGLIDVDYQPEGGYFMEHLTALQAAYLALEAVRPSGPRPQRLAWRSDKSNKLRSIWALMGPSEADNIQIIADGLFRLETYMMKWTRNL